MGLEGFWLLFSSVAAIIKGVCIFLNGDCRYTRVFKLLIYLGVGAYLAILSKGLYCHNFLLLEGPSCLYIMAFYKVSIKFPFGLSRDFKVGW